VCRWYAFFVRWGLSVVCSLSHLEFRCVCSLSAVIFRSLSTLFWILYEIYCQFCAFSKCSKYNCLFNICFFLYKNLIYSVSNCILLCIGTACIVTADFNRTHMFRSANLIKLNGRVCVNEFFFGILITMCNFCLRAFKILICLLPCILCNNE
jgi:hypothetical protein